MSNQKYVFQDGADFYDCDGSGIIKSYPHLVRGDFDMEGASAARCQFLYDHPTYRMESER